MINTRERQLNYENVSLFSQVVVLEEKKLFLLKGSNSNVGYHLLSILWTYLFCNGVKIRKFPTSPACFYRVRYLNRGLNVTLEGYSILSLNLLYPVILIEEPTWSLFYNFRESNKNCRDNKL